MEPLQRLARCVCVCARIYTNMCTHKTAPSPTWTGESQVEGSDRGSPTTVGCQRRAKWRGLVQLKGGHLAAQGA